MLLVIAVLIIVLLYRIQKRIYAAYWDKGVEVELSFDREEVFEDETAVLLQKITTAFFRQ